MVVASDAARDSVDAALGLWRQGDCVLGEHWFLFRADPDVPLTRAADEAAEQGVEIVEAEVQGFVIVTQTCDIVRSCDDRPFVELCPLAKFEGHVLSEIRRALRPRFLYVPGVNLVADLDRVMTVEKPVVAAWNRAIGCRDDAEARLLALQLSRKRARFAFPDDFVIMASSLLNRVKSKHGKGSAEGHALRGLWEIRVRAVPSWTSEEIELMFLFVRDDDSAQDQPWREHLQSWLSRVKPAGRFVRVDGLVTTLDALTARDYVESDRIDLGHLSVSLG